MSRTVAKELVETLAHAGVRRIYGLVDDSLNPVTDALHRSGNVDWVHVRHEKTTAFAAGADAHLTDKLAFCLGSCGPGNLSLINGLFKAPSKHGAGAGRRLAYPHFRSRQWLLSRDPPRLPAAA